MVGIPDLIIPIRMDKGAATASITQFGGKARTELGKVGVAGQKAGKDIADGMKGGERAAAGLGESLGGVAKAAMGLSIAKQIAMDIGQSFESMAKDIEQSAKEFQKLRETMQGVASLTGKQNTNKFAESEINAAQAANVTPEEYVRSRKAFLSRASLYIGNGPDAKLSDDEAQKFQASLAEFAKQKGVTQEEMGGFAGGLLAQQKGKTTAAEMQARAGKVFATLEASSADVGHLLPMMTRTMAQGFSAEEAAPLLASMPEIAPEEEGTYLLRAVSALRDKVIDEVRAKSGGKEVKGPKAAEFGLKEGQSPYEMLKSAVETLRTRSDKGENLNAMLAELAPESISQSALRGLVGQGPEGMAKWRQLVEKTPTDQLQRTIEEGR
jgi:hypothetical protein